MEVCRSVLWGPILQNPDCKIGLRSFMCLKPPQCCFMKAKDRTVCACHYHENTKLAVCAFNRVSAELHKGRPCGPDAPCNRRGKIPQSGYSLFQWLLCSFAATAEGAHAQPAVQAEWPPAPECVSGACAKCAGGLHKLQFCSKELELGGERNYMYNLYETQEQCDHQVRTSHMRATHAHPAVLLNTAPLYRNSAQQRVVNASKRCQSFS